MAEEKVKKPVTKKVAPESAAPKKEKAPKKDVAPKVEEAPKAEVAAKPVKKEAAPKAKKAPVVVKSNSRMIALYNEKIVGAMIEKFKYTSPMQVPKINKIVINMGVGDATQNAKLLEDAVKELTVIAGQKPVITLAKKSEASFKLREGQAIGTKVDLRGERMYEFLDKLITIALPRVRDFRGVSKNAFDGHGNYTLGVREQLIFAEIDFDLINKIRGMDVVIVTTAKTDEEAYELLSLFGMPFAR